MVNKRITLYKNPKIEIRKSNIHGWGVFAKDDIENNELLEECHGLFFFDCNLKEGVDFSFPTENGLMIPYGYGAIYNSSKFSNVIAKFKNKILNFYSTRDIHKNEELFINYQIK